ncbi:MAG: hypothetical protein OEZ01_00490 [Candidatus Heimdallarchaeota archaeon]|nr:hypothetical protein [Candidatus Heimdallarchaeota archaeon]MDH5644450.1 hypothetical protein [Candidatus Heimdallarchaeota archaeon]
MNLKQMLDQADSIIFVCSGNIIRSAYCHIKSIHYNIPRSIYSVGVKYYNTEIDPPVRTRLLKDNIDQKIIDSFNPTHITNFNEKLTKNDLFLCMTNEHLNLIHKYFPNNPQLLITQLLDEKTDIIDPYYTQNYDITFTKLDLCLHKLQENFLKIDDSN